MLQLHSAADPQEPSAPLVAGLTLPTRKVLAMLLPNFTGPGPDGRTYALVFGAAG